MYSNEVQDLVLESYKRVTSYASDAIAHYEHFMDHMMPYIIVKNSRVDVPSKDGAEKHVVQLRNIVVHRPSIDDSDPALRSLKTGQLDPLYPSEARARGLTYSAQILVDVEHSVYEMDDGKWELKGTPVVFKEMPLFEMPVMLRSKYCYTSLDLSGECWMDLGGYFIIRGNAKVIQPQKVQRINVHLVKGQKHNQVDMDIRSLRADEKFRSTSTLYMHLGGSPPVITVDIPFLKSGLPIICLFRFLGVHDQDQIEALLNHQDEANRRLFAANYSHPLAKGSFEDILDLAGSSLTVSDPSPEKIRRQVVQQVAGELLPHMGYDDLPHTRIKKLAYLAIIIRRMLDVYTGKAEADDRDFEGYKSVQMSAGVLSVMFRQQFAAYMKMLRNRIYDRAKKGKHLDVSTLMSDGLTRDVLKAFSEGEVTVQKDASNAGTSVIQMAQQVNSLGIQTHIQRVSTALPRDGKYKQLRGVDPTQLFVFCPSETPEGHGCGLLQNLATFAKVRVGTPLLVLAEAVLRLNHIRPFSTFADLCGSKLVFVNSDPIGCTDNEDVFVEEARKARRSQLLPFDCSIVRAEHGICISSDMGVVVFPLLYLPKMGEMAAALAQSNSSEELWHIMCRRGMVEYMDAYELLEYRVAFTPDAVEGCSHMAVHPSGFLGTSASSVPWPDHDQAPRVAYQAGMVKQAISTPAANVSDRMDLGYTYNLWYPQRPVADTAIARASKMNEWPLGENLIIAIAPYGGCSQEDSIIRNRGSVERGSGRVTTTRIFKATCRKRGTEQELFEHPFSQHEVKCEGIRGSVCYDKICADGLPEEGIQMKNGDVIIGRVLHSTESIPTEHSSYPSEERQVRRDRSIVLQCEPTEIWVVDKVMVSITKEGHRMARVRLRSMRAPQEGDKISSRHGQKGTIGVLMNEEDLPYVMAGNNAGMRPDAIINLHSINGRMTIGKLLEILFSSLGLVEGEFVDATPFRQVNARWAMEELMKSGYGTEEYMIDGCSGKMMQRPWFIGSCFYQTLKHMVLDKITVRQRGQRAVLTRQPLDGRANQGGQRMGEMEKDAFLAHGAAYSLDDRSRIASDAHTALVCTKCGHIGDSKEETLRTISQEPDPCRVCGSGDIVTLPTTYCYSRLLVPELATCGVKVVHKFNTLASSLEDMLLE
jgi:DNA-directed RNA polymerase II subunit RPB2